MIMHAKKTTKTEWIDWGIWDTFFLDRLLAFTLASLMRIIYCQFDAMAVVYTCPRGLLGETGGEHTVILFGFTADVYLNIGGPEFQGT
ncbi:MAG: hypothetical protein EA424_07015 [Planctomycetaceae bacterium]|nr:MAG: hypothetical protein EA424_07015 [Planctomycetaceae bacterium]